ncbi:MAG: hypothetical protein KGY70_12090 [Bacteroidales bacterium]|nr:hypothetical protein [Bacteroidales bacterium]
MSEKQYNILLVGGNSRKAGKTELICRLLENFGKEYSIAAVKVALYGDRDIFRGHYPQASEAGYLEIKENNPRLMKDSGKYLAAGAAESWFLVSITDNEEKVVQKIMEISNHVNLMIVESNALRSNLEPGIFVMVNKRGKEQKQSAKAVSSCADLIVETGGEMFRHIERYIKIDNHTWNLKKRYDIF